MFRNLSTAIEFAFVGIWSHRFRSFLTTLGVVIGVMTVISIVAVVQGLNKSFADQLSAWGSNVLYIQKYPWFSMEDYSIFRNRKNFKLSDADAIRQSCPALSQITVQMSSGRSAMANKHEITRLEVTGTTESNQEISNDYVAWGRYLTSGDVEHARHVAVLGYSVAQTLYPDRDPIGQPVSLGGHRFEIVGVVEKKGKFLFEDQDNFVTVPITTFQKAFGSHRSATIVAQASSAEALSEAKEQIRTALRRIRKVPYGKPDDFALNEQGMLLDMYHRLTNAAYIVMIGVAALSLLVGGIGIMNIMLVTVTERTKEIGIRMAVGAKRSDIRVQFLLEAVTLSGVGGGIGIAMGFIIAMAVNKFSPLPATVTWWSVVVGFAFSAAVGIFFGLWPAYRASRLDPIESMRYE